MDIEFQSATEIKQFQEALLQQQLLYLQAQSPYYQRVFADKGINVKTIQHIEDLTRLPFTEKQDLQLQNADFFFVP